MSKRKHIIAAIEWSVTFVLAGALFAATCFVTLCVLAFIHG